jgi:hypothetical protein
VSEGMVEVLLRIMWGLLAAAASIAKKPFLLITKLLLLLLLLLYCIGCDDGECIKT